MDLDSVRKSYQRYAPVYDATFGWLLGDRGWYPRVSEALFRWGLERPTREVVERFLGGPVRPTAILEDMGRLKH